MAVLFALTALVLAASLAAAMRLYPTSRAEQALAAFTLAFGVIQLSIQALGWSSHLDRASLALGVFAASVVLFALGLRGPDPAQRLRAFSAGLREHLALPVTAIRMALEARSPILALGLLVVFGVVVWTAWLAYLAPSGSWDGVWYHEPMAYFAIQNHGFELVDVPLHLAKVNTHPRTSENLMLWACIFGDRTLVDAVPSAVFPLAMLGTYCMTAAHVRSKIVALGASVVVMSVPAALLQLRSTYVDLTVMAAFVAGAHYALKPDLRSRDAWMAALGIGLACGTKANQVVFGAVLFAIVCVRMIALAWTERRGRQLLHPLGGLLLILALAAPDYVRTYLDHDNPVWPIRVDSARFDVHLPGPYDIQDMQWPLGTMLHEMYDVPSQGQDYHDTRRHAYGYGLTYVGLPLLLLALIVLLAGLPRAWVRRDRAEVATRTRLLLMFAVGALTFVTSPALYWARFSLGGVALGVAVVAWLLERRSWGIAPEGVLSAMIFANLLTLAWAQPAWEVSFTEALELSEIEPAERVFANTSLLFTPGMRRMREERIGAGDVVVFDDDLAFPGNLWNEALTNRVLYVPFTTRDEYLERLDALGAEWVAMYEFRDEYRAVDSRPETWREIGRAHFEIRVFERLPTAVSAGDGGSPDAGMPDGGIPAEVVPDSDVPDGSAPADGPPDAGS